MDSVKLLITSVDSNENVMSTTVSNINPNASDATMAAFAIRLNSLSSNTFVSVAKVTTTDITDEVANNG